MALHGKGSKIIKDGFNLSCFIQDVDIPMTIDEVETTTLCDENSKTFIQGQESVTLSANGFFDGDVDEIDTVLNASKRSLANVWTLFPNADTAGNAGTGVEGIRTNYQITNTFDDATKIAITGRGNTEKELIQSLVALSTLSASGNSASLDNSASSANGGAIYLQATAITGTVSVIVEDSPDDGAWSTLASFTDVSAIGGERVAVSGTIDRYTRATYTLDGGESITMQVSINRK